eukprot:2646359-Rhodomonas_salina.1
MPQTLDMTIARGGIFGSATSRSRFQFKLGGHVRASGSRARGARLGAVGVIVRGRTCQGVLPSVRGGGPGAWRGRTVAVLRRLGGVLRRLGG